MQSITIIVSVGMSVCLSARISHKPHVYFHQIFRMLPVAVARSSCDDNAIRYVLPVLWMTSCFHTMKLIQRRGVCFVQFARWRHRWRSLTIPTASVVISLIILLWLSSLLSCKIWHPTVKAFFVVFIANIVTGFYVMLYVVYLYS